MILIYEHNDLTDDGKVLPLREVDVGYVRNDKRQLVAEAYAETIYIEGTESGLCMMVKQRNGPLDPYPCVIEYKRARF